MATRPGQSEWQGRMWGTAIAIGGCLVAVLGCGAVVCTYAFASIVPPELVGWERHRAILGKMLLTPSVVVVFVGLTAVATGVVIVVAALGIVRGRSTIKKRTLGIVAAVGLCLAGLLAASM